MTPKLTDLLWLSRGQDRHISSLFMLIPPWLLEMPMFLELTVTLQDLFFIFDLETHAWSPAYSFP